MVCTCGSLVIRKLDEGPVGGCTLTLTWQSPGTGGATTWNVSSTARSWSVTSSNWLALLPLGRSRGVGVAVAVAVGVGVTVGVDVAVAVASSVAVGVGVGGGNSEAMLKT